MIFPINCLTRVSFLQKSIVKEFNVPADFSASFSASLCYF